jgi:hypothetical protein
VCIHVFVVVSPIRETQGKQVDPQEGCRASGSTLEQIQSIEEMHFELSLLMGDWHRTVVHHHLANQTLLLCFVD